MREDGNIPYGRPRGGHQRLRLEDVLAYRAHRRTEGTAMNERSEQLGPDVDPPAS